MPIVYDHVYIDTETTGLDPRLDEIVECTAIEYNLSGEIGAMLTRRCRPESGIMPKAASDIHHITYDMVKGEKSWLRDGVRIEFARFIAKRTLVGHNIVSFDSKFLKIDPIRVVDTLLMSREMFPGAANNLKSVCRRVNIEFDEKMAHTSRYDVEKGLQLHLKLNKIKMKKEEKSADLPIFTENAPTRVVVGKNEKELFYTQTWSYSRFNMFHTCPFKWYMIYVKKMKEPDHDHFKIGNVCHKIAEEAGKWCYKRTIINKIVSFKGRDLNFDPTIVFSDVTKIPEYFPGCNGLYDLIHKLDMSITDYEKVSMPDREEYDRIVNSTLVNYSVKEPEMINEIKYIMDKFYIKRDLSTSINGVLITEKKIALDKNWKILDDYYSKDTWIRFIIDVIKYDNGTVVITDYKSSRTMMSEKEIKNDPQLRLYALAVYHFLPRDSYKKIIIKIDYIRFCKEISYEVEDIDAYVGEAKQWIEDSIKLIESNFLDPEGSFQPKRNEYCGTCFLAENSTCPLFNRKFINHIDDPQNFVVRCVDDCAAAFKRAEILDIERKGLIKKCQEFIKSSDIPVVIDENARLGFYTKAGIDISAEKFAILMLKKKFKTTDFISAFSVTKKSLEWIEKKLNSKLSKEELDSISDKNSTVKFLALTKEEMDGYENV
jgi:DNA polymerase III subunit epsilon